MSEPMSEERLAEIEERRVQVSLGRWAMPLPHDPSVWTHQETGHLVDADVPDLIAEVRKLKRDLDAIGEALSERVRVVGATD